EERRPAKVEGCADLGPIYDDPETKRMQAKSQRLMFGGGHQGLSDAQKNTPEWRAELLDYVNAIENWKPALAKSELEVFVLKEGFLSSIIWIAPPGPDRDRLIGRFVASLKISGVQQESWIDWFERVDTVLSLTRSLHPEAEPKILETLEASGHPVLVLYAKLERTLPSRSSASEKSRGSR